MIHKMMPEQLETAMDIWLTVNKSAHAFISPEYWDAHYEAVKNEYFPQSQTFVYEENGVLCAFLSLVKEEYIGALFVRETHQSKGIGAELINFCKERFPKLTLCVYKDNVRALQFYQKLGFEITACSLAEDGVHEEYSMMWMQTHTKTH